MDWEEIRNTALGIVVWAGIIGVAVFGGKACERGKEQNANSQQERADREFGEFCKANNLTSTLNGLPKGDMLTVELQRLLFVNSKPVAFRGKLYDLWRSKQYAAMMVRFSVDYNDRTINAYLKCSGDQAKQIEDEYHKDKDAEYLIGAAFERAGAIPTSGDSNSTTETVEAYEAVGTLIALQIAKEHEPMARSEQSDHE